MLLNKNPSHDFLKTLPLNRVSQFSQRFEVVYLSWNKKDNIQIRKTDLFIETFYYNVVFWEFFMSIKHLNVEFHNDYKYILLSRLLLCFQRCFNFYWHHSKILTYP